MDSDIYVHIHVTVIIDKDHDWEGEGGVRRSQRYGRSRGDTDAVVV